MSVPINVQPDLSEKLSYNYDGLPFFLRQAFITQETGYDAMCHWHPELEFIYIVSGERDYYVNGKTFRLKAGEGLFVNSKRLHNGFSFDCCDCHFIVMSLHPRLFTGSSENLGIEAENRFGPGTCDYLCLTESTGWQAQILEKMRQARNLLEEHPDNPLLPLANAIGICGILWDHITPAAATAEDHRNLNCLLQMTDFIRKHYSEKISIEEIAKSGTVCRSKGCRIFKEYLRQSPNEYLNNYRLSKSRELLHDTEMDITDVALSCGFQSSSYFISSFRRKWEMTPGQYRESAGLRA